MIGIVDVQIAAHNPAMPLFPMRAFLNSPSSVRIRNVPKQIGSWKIDKVYFQATYPDGSVKSVDCILVGGIWVGTISGATTVGNVQNGYTVYADGVDENNNAVNGFILGKGDVQILESDGTVVPGQTLCYVHMLSAEPSEPKTGDLWQVSGSWYVYQDGQSWPIGDDSGLIGELSSEISAKADLSSLSGCMRLCPSQPEHPVEGDVWYEPFQRITQVWHNNEWLAFAASPYYVHNQLANYERKANMKSDVSSIVTAKAFTDWNYPAEIDGKYYAPDTDWLNEHGDHDKTYYVMNVEYVGEETGWSIVIWSYAWWDDPDFGSWQPQGMYPQTIDAPEDMLSLTLAIPEELGGGTLTLTREYVNEIGLAMMSDLSAVTLPQDESNALANYTEDQYKTKVTFKTNDVASKYITQIFDWQGEVNSSMLSDLELSAIEGIKFGHGVSAIADGAFQNIGTNFHEIYFSDSLRRIGISAFAGNVGLYKVVYGDDTPRIKYDENYAYNINEGGELSIGDSAFQGCTLLGQAILPDIDKLTVGENAFAGCNFTYSTVINGQMIHTAGIFFRNFYNQSDFVTRLDAHNLSAERVAGICHSYIPATIYDIDKAGQENDSKYLGTYADAKFSVTARGANLALSASIVNNIHISADPSSSKTKNINLPVSIYTDHSPRSLTVDLSVDAGVTFAGTVNKTTTMDWYLDGTMEQYRNEFLSAGAEVLWKFWEYKPNVWCAKKLGVR